VFGTLSYVPLAPGGIISIYGSLLAGSPEQAGAVPLPDELVDTQVFMAGLRVPLYYVSPGQVNAVVPYELNANLPQYLLVQRGATVSIPVLVNVADAQPSMLGMITAYPAAGGLPYTVSASTPAHAGDTLTIYCTGLGTVMPPVSNGAVPANITNTVNTPQLLIGNQPANVTFSGLSSFPGLYQINAVIAPGTPTGDAVPVTLTIAGQIGQPVSIAIQ
jgi:uncharacterized protein (TIGR03437 family)